uniref:Uncharacterized protein n=2 Tax=Avena sativa TaxID=4498 RepID=A0ACD5Y208_AVESA
MEAALLSGVLKPAADKLVTLIASEFASIIGVTKDLAELQDLFGDITNWLSAVGVEATDSGSSPNWLKQLKAVTDDFDDLLYRLEAEKHKADMNSKNHVMANWCCTKPKSALSRTKMAHEIKEIKRRFAKIVKQRSDFNAIASSTFATHHVQPTRKTRGELSILANTTDVLGRDEVKYNIVSKLVEADTQERILIVSIAGLGGSGKTTLAKYVCQDSKIKNHFEVVFWVHVSQEFEVEKLLGKLFESVSNEKSELQTLQHKIKIISEKLSKRNFLLVLDDVWNKDKHEWEQFEQHLNNGAPGSKILLTTRDGKVAEAVKSAEIFHLPFLSDDDGWILFQRSSGWAEEGLDPEFIEVGKEIVKKCAGVPIAIKSLAGNLHGKRDLKEWRYMRDSNLLTNSDIKSRVFESLWLSYFLLSDDLKQCFLLCSIFPKGYNMDKAHLISQWIAHGFVSSGNGSQQLEDIGSDYFDSLLKVSFLQDLDEHKVTGRVTCKMHDLVHELTRQILKDEITVIPTNSTNDHNQICRYLSVASSTGKVERKLFNKLRALFVMGGSFAMDKPIKKGYCVRSVILEDIIYVPLFLSKFEYLGYLRISYSICQELPEAITDCWNLQALHVINCYRFATLPESIGKLRKLRTLELSHVGGLKSLPQSIGDCHGLESLHLIDCSDFKKIPDSFCQNENLRLLNIVDCKSLLHLPSGTFQKLRSLETINLSGCYSLEDLPGSFACDKLHTFKLCELTKLTVLSESITSLSNLKHLDLKGCRGLVELPAGIDYLKKLVVLNLKGCSGLVELPAGIVSLRRLVVLNLEGCYELRGLQSGLGQLTRLETLGLFVIGDGSQHARISELGSLDRLSGNLKICFGFVKDPDDAEKANLKQKNNLRGLRLSFGEMDTEMEQEARMELEMAVLNFLEPPSGIESLSVFFYKGLCLPRWLTKKRHLGNLDRKFEQIVDPPHFPHLTHLSLDCHPNVKHLTGLVELPSLKGLSLYGFDTLESINIGPFPSLYELLIRKMPHSLELTTATRAILVDSYGLPKMQCCFPRLSALYIFDCPKLNLNPCFPASLKNLSLSNSIVWPVHPLGDKSESPSCSKNNGVSPCSTLLNKLEIRLMSVPSCTHGWEFLQHLGAFESLKITYCDEELKQLPESMRTLTTLQVHRLEIAGCSGLCVLPWWLRELRSLQNLKISGCINLRVLSEGWLGELGSLQKLKINGCTNLKELSEEWLGELHSLKVLKINNCPSLRELPEGIQHLTSLHELSIGCCNALHQLPEFGSGELHSLVLYELPCLSRLPESMRILTSLQVLHIEECGAVQQLPEGLGELSSLRTLMIGKLPLLTSLPVSLQGLVNLEHLDIGDCAAFDQLPDQLGKLRSLQSLFISNLPLLTCLPESIGQLSALRTLSIHGCRGLTFLPRSIQRLTNLQRLELTGNPDVARRYKQGAGKDWHLISHIPNVEISDVVKF